MNVKFMFSLDKFFLPVIRKFIFDGDKFIKIEGRPGPALGRGDPENVGRSSLLFRRPGLCTLGSGSLPSGLAQWPWGRNQQVLPHVSAGNGAWLRRTSVWGLGPVPEAARRARGSSWSPLPPGSGRPLTDPVGPHAGWSIAPSPKLLCGASPPSTTPLA